MTDTTNAILTEQVLTFLAENAGKKYTLQQLGHEFNATTANVRLSIAKLGAQVEFSLNARIHVYYMPTIAELKAREDRKNRPLKTHAKPYVLPQSMIDARNRAAEMYPNGGNFKSIS